MGIKNATNKMKFKQLKHFIKGIGSVFNLMPQVSPEVKDILNKTNSQAIADDWKAVGDDIRTVITNQKRDK
jgi:uncharacterized protein (UPF0335 family)